MKRIVLTGGPSSGKTRLTQLLAERHPERFVRVPEAATQVYAELQTRWDRLDLEGKRNVQRTIYRVQAAQEDAIACQHPDRILLLDRGTLDGAAYWPEGPSEYWRDLQTAPALELARYDAVIWMETSATLGLYDGDASNACRFEDAAAAVLAGQKLIELWGGHPHFFQLQAFPNFAEKVSAAEAIINNAILALPR